MTEPAVTASPAVLLREAASKMRELAQAATPGPWRSWNDGHVGSRRTAYGGLVMPTTGCPVPHEERIANAVHIAAWHPAVALAVADWLDHAAARAECKIANGGGEGPVWSHEHDALSVARVSTWGGPMSETPSDLTADTVYWTECPQPDCQVEIEERTELTVRADLRKHLTADHGYGAWGADRVLSGVAIYEA